MLFLFYLIFYYCSLEPSLFSNESEGAHLDGRASGEECEEQMVGKCKNDPLCERKSILNKKRTLFF